VHDVLLRGGWVLDGTGAPAFRADVAVDDGRIARVGALPEARAEREIDTTGRYITPGFVDAHVHGDGAVLDPAVQLAALRQGVTTFALGQDGLSYAPATPAALAYVTRCFAAINGTHPGLGAGPVTVADLLATYTGTTALNTAYLVPHGTVRRSVLGPTARPADAADLAAMARMTEQALDEGACGISTKLEYAAHPARRFGLYDRGLIRPGMAADLAVVDPAAVADRADYDDARRLADGIADVLVAGVPVLAAGELTGHTPGRPLQPR
jgi:N-acyl-D-amino-acid deacylase